MRIGDLKIHLKNISLQIVGVIAVVAFFLYLPIVGAGFFADDVDFATRAANGSLWRAAVFPIDGAIGAGSWRPLTGALFMLSFLGNAAFNHAVSLALFVALICAVFYLGRAFYFSDQRSALGAVLFALLPVHAEPVAWIAARADLLASLCAVLAWIFFARGRRTMALIFFLASLLAKEVWVFLPLVWLYQDGERKKNVQWWMLVAGSVAVWLGARYLMTGYGWGGYSVVAIELAARAQLMVEQVVGFAAGVGLWGPWQNWAVLFVRERWIVSGGVCVLVAVALWRRFRTTPYRTLLLAVVATTAPISVLVITFPVGMSWVGEQRYWLAPSVGAALFVGALLGAQWRTLERLMFAIVFVWFAVGLAYNVNLFSRAARYREDIISQWQLVTIPHQKTVALLPDSFHGVHIFAEPYFFQTLALRGLQTPRNVLPVYQACARRCMQEPVELSATPDSLQARTPTPRLFSLREFGMHRSIKIPLQSEKFLYWSGSSFVMQPDVGVENQPKSRY